MIKNKLIIMPLDGKWQHSADYFKQTALELSINNQIIIYDQENSYFFLKYNLIKNNYPHHKNIKFYQVKYFLPWRRFALIEKLNRLISYKLFLMKNYKTNRIVWFFNSNHHDLAKFTNQSALKIYDCVDYDANTKNETKLISQVNYFFVNSKSLCKLHQNLTIKPIYLSAQGFFVPKQIKKVQLTYLNSYKPLIGFVGGINYRLDFKLTAELIEKNQQWQFIFCGPKQTNQLQDEVHQTANWLKKIKKYDNVKFIGNKNKNYVYNLINKFDVALIPYNNKITFNQYCYPMKAFEYIYFNKPIVSTNIIELESNKFKKYITIAKTSKEFTEQIQLLLNRQVSKKQSGEKLSLKNSWANKIKQISYYLDNEKS